MSSDTSGQAGYDGSNDAWLLTTTGAGGRLDQNISSTGVQSYSVYAKANTYDYLFLIGLGALDRRGFFDLANGVVGTTQNLIDSSIHSVGNGWYKCTIVFNDTINQVRIAGLQGDSDFTGTSGSIYIQDAQLEQGMVARDYIETTTAAVEGGITDNVPRLDYTDSSCPALLLEPQRTNHYHQSEYFSTGSRAIITNNATTSPEGVSNATSVVATSVSGSHEVTLSPIISIGNTNPRTFSLYAKYNGNHLILNVAGSSTAWTGCIFDLQNGVAKTPENNGSQSLCTASIEDAGDGWYRCSVTYTPYASGGFLHLISLTDDVNATLTTWGAASYVGDDVSGIYIYGAQVEQGSYATSYIPTYGTSVTRNNDETDVTGLQSKGILSSTQGTMFFHITDIEGTAVVFNAQTANDLSYALRFIARDNGFQTFQRVNDVQTTIRGTSSLTLSEWKIAMSWNGTNLITSLNGTSYIDTIDASIASQLDAVKRVNPQAIYVTTNQILVFPTQLTEAELNDLTTL